MTSPTGNPIIDSILWGGARWPEGPIRYYFSDAEDDWTEAEKASYRAALQAWANVADLEFEEVSSESEANFVEYKVDSSFFGGRGVLGLHETPGDLVFPGWQAAGYYNWEGYGAPDGSGFNLAALLPGGFGFTTFLHELGHGLGLAHPHDTGGGSPVMPGVGSAFGDYGDNGLNQGVFTVMSYNDGWAAVQQPFANGIATHGYAAGPSALDIAAIQYLYGANTTHNAGDDVYEIPEAGGWLSIWDTGGIDTIVYNGSGDAVIDLNSATLDNSPSGGGFPSYVRNSATTEYYGGYTIAGDFTDALPDRLGETGVIIERAFGGSGDDLIRGNGVANLLRGNAGRDTLLGAGGDDRIYGGGQNDSVEGHSGQDTLFGDAGDDVLGGGDGPDRIKGGADRDTIRGGEGDDVLIGQNGVDVVGGGPGRDTLQGNNGDDTLMGQQGDDSIKGGNNWDLVQGGAGNDTVDGQRGNDRVEGNAGHDRVLGKSGHDTLVGGTGDDVLLGDSGNDFLNGDDGADTLDGGTGRDTLMGAEGDDLLTGGAGPDLFRFRGDGPTGDDTVTDFENGTDLIKLDRGVAFDDLTIAQVGGDTVITWDNGSVTLQGETGVIDADDFLFV